MRASAGAAGEEASVLPSQVQGPIRGQQLPNVVNPDAPVPVAPSTPSAAPAPRARPAWLERVQRGRDFNAEQAPNYPYNEVYIDQPGGGYTRLDSYDLDTGEIVSRKLTQLSEVQEQTAVNYINEIPSKYPVGGTIANVPSSGAMAGNSLAGQYILEVPVQTNPVPQAVIDAANQAGVVIRDTAGRTYP